MKRTKMNEKMNPFKKHRKEQFCIKMNLFEEIMKNESFWEKMNQSF